MNYLQIYNRLIERGRHRVLTGYQERHHIIPRCMGGSDDRENLVGLTPEEHLVAHLLLVRIYPSEPKLKFAASYMVGRVGKHTNKQYGWAKREAARAHSMLKLGVPRSEESVAKQRATIKDQFESGRHGCRLGTTLSEEHKEAISVANSGKSVPIESRSSLEGYVLRYGPEQGPQLYAEHNAKKDSASLQAYIERHGESDGPILYQTRNEQKSKTRSTMNIGLVHSEETRRKISEQKKGKKIERTAEHNAKISAARKGKPQQQSTCIHCGLVTSFVNINRWHNDHCKKKPV